MLGEGMGVLLRVQVGQRHDRVAMLYALHHAVAAVLPTGHQRDDAHVEEAAAASAAASELSKFRAVLAGG